MAIEEDDVNGDCHASSFFTLEGVLQSESRSSAPSVPQSISFPFSQPSAVLEAEYGSPRGSVKRLLDKRLSFKLRRMSAGQNTAVFQIDLESQVSCETGDTQKAKTPDIQLWWVLAGFFLLFMLIATCLLAYLWIEENFDTLRSLTQMHSETLLQYHQVYTDCADKLAIKLQDQMAAVSKKVITDFLKLPGIVVGLNVDAMRSGVELMSVGNVEGNLRQMWEQLRNGFPALSSVYYADHQGTFTGYSRLKNASHSFGVAFRLHTGMASSACPTLCPQTLLAERLARTFYYASSNGSFLDRYASEPFDPRESSWYRKAVSARGRTVWSVNTDPYGRRGVVLTASKAFLQDGQVLMVAGADVALEGLAPLLQQQSVSDGSRIFIVDADRNVLATASDQAGRSTGNEQLYQVLAARCAWQGSFSSGQVRNEAGQRFVCARRPLQLGEGEEALKWDIVSIHPTDMYTGSTYHRIDQRQQDISTEHGRLHRQIMIATLVTLALSVVFIVVGVCCAGFVARDFTSPLEDVRSYMRAVAKLDFAALPEDLGGDKVVPYEQGVSAIGRVGGQVREVIEMRNSVAYMAKGLKSFSKFMDPYIVQMLVQSNRQAKLGMAEADATIFFSDIVDFSSMAEKLEPKIFMELLSEYLDAMSTIIMQRSGVVGEFIGDAIMAWWNVPLDLGEKHTVIALTAALEQQRLLAELREKWCCMGLPVVKARMGVVRGQQVLAGNMGSSKRMKYGLVGDDVNLASRLEGLCKRYDVSIIIDNRAECAPGVNDKFHCRPIDLVHVQGRSEPVELFELVSSRGQDMGFASPATSSLYSNKFCDDFAEVQSLYRGGDFAGALEKLAAYEKLWPRDKPARLLKERCQALLAAPPKDLRRWSPVQKLA